jgi:DNA adenine methylase
MTAKPFAKWVGGKRALLPHLRARVPAQFNRYFEPFVGGGAMFFDMQPPMSQLTDMNAHLIRTYAAVRDDVENVIAQASALAAANCREFYYAARSLDPAELDDAAAAAWFLYVNSAGFNGLWRVNKAGRLNVPYGSKNGAFAVDVDNMRACSAALQNARIAHAHYADAVADARDGDFVYFDPPYVPMSASSSFTAYTADGFHDAEQLRLAATIRALKARGVFVLVSNSGAPRVRELYAGLTIHEVARSGRISCKGDGRAPVKEVIAW